MLISGYALRYGVGYLQGDPDRPTRFTEIVEPGAADYAIGYGDVTLDVGHAPPPLARTSDGSLKLVSDRKGLWYCVELDHGWSEFGFNVAAIEDQVIAGKMRASWQGNVVGRWEDWRGNQADPLTAPVHRIYVFTSLHSVCLTPTPANLTTSARVAAALTWQGEPSRC